MKLASFDIFDTLLIRKCGAPEGVFYLLAHRLFPDDATLRDSFFIWRMRAGQIASCIYENSDLSLEQTYSSLDPIYCTKYSPSELMRLEQEVEASQLSLNPAIKALVDSKREAGYTICFISDMYLDSLFLRELLALNNVIKDGEEVFVSCEYSKRKSNGGLYDVVRNKFSPKSWEHYGDNRHSDVKMAKRKGIKATLVDTSFTPAERQVIDNNRRVRNRYELSIFVGFLRHARITNGNDGYAEIAADFVSTLYLPFVLNLLETATKEGTQSIYFLNRDSYIFMKIAESLKGLYPTLRFNYLYISRRSLILPYLYKKGASDLLAVMDANTIVKKSVKSLLGYLNITEDELSQCGVSFEYKRIRDRADQSDFLNKIFSGSIYDLLQSRCKAQRDLLMRYFEQEGILNQEESVLVDVGWLGTTRMMINAILRLDGYKDVLFSYYGVRGDAIGAEYGRYHTYVLPDTLPYKVAALVEQYFSAAPYSSTLCYGDEGGVVTAVLNGDVGRETEQLARINSSVSIDIASLIVDYPYFRWGEILSICEEEFFSILTNQRHRLNVESFVQCAEFDGNIDNGKMKIVKRLSASEMIRYMLLGEDITVLDGCSVRYSYGSFIAKNSESLHRATSKLRTTLYRISLRIKG